MGGVDGNRPPLATGYPAVTVRLPSSPRNVQHAEMRTYPQACPPEWWDLEITEPSTMAWSNPSTQTPTDAHREEASCHSCRSPGARCLLPVPRRCRGATYAGSWERSRHTGRIVLDQFGLHGTVSLVSRLVGRWPLAGGPHQPAGQPYKLGHRICQRRGVPYVPGRGGGQDPCDRARSSA